MTRLLKIPVVFLAYILGLFASDDWKETFFNCFIFEKNPQWKVDVLKIFNGDYNEIENESGNPFFCCGETSNEPGVPPTPSDQGQFKSSCTLHSIGKCIVSYLDRNGLDADQDEIIQNLEKKMGTQRMWPTSCNNKDIKIQAKKKNGNDEEIELTLTLLVDKMKFDELQTMEIPNTTDSEFVLCTSQLSKNDNHSVYIKEKAAKSTTLSCINSWGSHISYPTLVAKSCSSIYAVEIKKKNEYSARLDQNADGMQENQQFEDKNMEKEKPAIKNVFEVHENVQSTVAEVLASITVSKNKYDYYQKELKGKIVSDWQESAESNVFLGVRTDKYKEFLGNIQVSTGIDEKTMKAFENMEFTEGSMNNNVKIFTCNNTKSNLTKTYGKYGMYVALKHDQTIDIAYSMYTYEAAFAGSFSTDPKKSRETVKKIGPLTSGVREVLTGEMMDLGQNWVTTQALENFVQHGTIKAVKFIEDIKIET